MNVKNINNLISVLKSIDDSQFNIKHLFTGPNGQESNDDFEDNGTTRVEFAKHTCNTAACVAGWSLVARDLANPALAFSKYDDIHEAGDYLGIKSSFTRNQMFMPEGYYTHPELYTRKKAIKMLQNYKKTGVVEWKVEVPVNEED